MLVKGFQSELGLPLAIQCSPEFRKLPIHLFPVCPTGQFSFHILLDKILTPCSFIFLLQLRCYLDTTGTVGGRDHILIRTLLFLFS